MKKPFSQACENNKEPILEILRVELDGAKSLLEIGSGTGQHAAYFSRQLPGLKWQCSDLQHNHPGIQAWLDDMEAVNALPPIHLDVSADWPETKFDAIFTANTFHIMPWYCVECFFEQAPRRLSAAGKILVYGPFNYQGQYTSVSNASFDSSLRARDPAMGLRDIEAVVALASSGGLKLKEDYTMPANNRLLVFDLLG